MPELKPVDYNPFAVELSPVEHDPFVDPEYLAKRPGEPLRVTVRPQPDFIPAERMPAGPSTTQQVSEFVGARIARFKRPTSVAFTDALPRAADGGVDRDAVKSRWGNEA